MKTINQLLTQGEKPLAKSGTSSYTEPQRAQFTTQRLSLADVRYLFKRFAAIYGYAFTSQYQDVYQELQDDWLEGLQGLTPQQLERGIKYCRDQRNEKWPPSVGEFRGYCYPTLAELGIPEPEDGYRCAVGSEWSHPIVWLAVERIGAFEFRTQSEKQVKPQFLAIYTKLAQEAVEGKRFQFPAQLTQPRLTEQEAAVSDSETGRQWLAKCREILAKKPNIDLNEQKAA